MRFLSPPGIRIKALYALSLSRSAIIGECPFVTAATAGRYFHEVRAGLNGKRSIFRRPGPHGKNLNVLLSSLNPVREAATNFRATAKRW